MAHLRVVKVAKVVIVVVIAVVDALTPLVAHGVVASAGGAGECLEVHVWRPSDITLVDRLVPPNSNPEDAMVSMDFSVDSKLLIGLLRRDMPRLLVWDWRSTTCVASVKAHADSARFAISLPCTKRSAPAVLTGSATHLHFWGWPAGAAPQ